MQYEYNERKEENHFDNDFEINSRINHNKHFEQRPRSTGFKSFLKWFKKLESVQKSREEDDSSSISSLSGEENNSSASSTATVDSFAFLPANVYRPYGEASQPEKFITPGPYTETYHRLIKERNKRRYLERNLSLRKKYSLYSSGTIDTKNNNIIDETTLAKTLKVYNTFSLPLTTKHNGDSNLEINARKTASLSTKVNKTCHVKGKRKAPLPPVNVEIKTFRKKRRAPAPPSQQDKECLSNNQVYYDSNYNAHEFNSNMPNFKCDVTQKMWFKRQSNDINRDKKKGDSKKKGKHDFPDIGFFRRPKIFEKKDDNIEEKNEKRISCYLPNISELDREAKEILKHKKQLVNNMDNGCVSNDKCNKSSSARDLINKFNALTSYSQQISKGETSNENRSPISLLLRKSSKNINFDVPIVANTVVQKSSEELKKCEKCNQLILKGNSCEKCNTTPAECVTGDNKISNIFKSDSTTSFQKEVFSALSNFNHTLDPELNKNVPDITSESENKNNTLNNNDMDEKIKLKEMLKEMKNSLPKRSKQLQMNKSTNSEVKQKGQHSVEKINADNKKSIFNTSQINKIAEKYKEKTVINDNLNIKPTTDYKDENNALHKESNKVSSSAQTTCSALPETTAGSAGNKDDTKGNIYMNVTSEDQTNHFVTFKQLEEAISNGNHELAAKLAKDLALLKVKCSVTTSVEVPTPRKKKSIQIYIEDQFSHQGPISVNIPENIKIFELKEKINKEFNIPNGVQKWIVKKQLVINDHIMLKEYNQGNFNEPLFLYVVSGESKKHLNKEVTNTPTAPPHNKLSNISNIENKVQVQTTPSTSIQVIRSSSGDMHTVNKKTWVCGECTLVNSVFSPICSVCGVKKSQGSPNHSSSENEANKAKNNVPVKKNEHYMQLVNLDNADLIPNAEQFECPICLSDCTPNAGMILRECLHSFCKECLANVVKYCDEVEVKCPYRDKNYFCDSTLLEREIRALVSKNIFEKHLTKSISVAENKIQNTFHCKTPNCKGWCIYEENVNYFKCPICKKNNCLTCQAIHENKNCKEYQQMIKNADENSSDEIQRTKQMLNEMVKRGEAMACPSCQVVLMKKWGCDWVKCSMCKTEICWVTRGARWGPGGKGDTSAGCQCGLNGLKCHPKCNYCH